MSNSPPEAADAKPKQAPFGFVDIRDLAALLIRREELHEGLYEPAVKFTMMAANFKINEVGGPGVLSTVESIGLTRVQAPTPFTIDAAVVNPRPDAPKHVRKRTPRP